MGRFWSLLFLSVPILGTLVIIAGVMKDGPFLYNHWLPENISHDGWIIDSLFMFILYLTGAIFIATGLVLFWFLWKYDAAKNAEPIKYSHGNHTLEVVWSILPAATLLFIAIFQMDSFAQAKMRRPKLANGKDDKPPMFEVKGRQFEWRIRYAGKDGEIGTTDDVHVVNDLHIPVEEEIVMTLKSEDVLHSFFLPNMRVKQDAVPGMKQFLWFKAVKTGKYDIVCAELCGWGHYKMRGRLIVEPREKFERWLEEQYREQETTQLAVVKKEGGDE